MNALLPFAGWVPILDGDEQARALFERHYSRKPYADGREPKLIVGPGQKLLLATPCRRALFAWRKFESRADEAGVNCAIFRNEGQPELNSVELIRLADAIADERWPEERRHYTYVTPGAVRSANPGYCFKLAGWRHCGVTKVHKRHILERVT